MRDADCTRSVRTLPTTDTAAHTPTTTSLAPSLVAPSLWIALVPGLRMGLATMSLLSTRTRGAGCTRSLPTLLTMDSDAHTSMLSSSALSLVAPSQWTVLAPGLPTELATTTPRTTRTGGAGCTSTALTPLTTDMDAHTPTTTSSARPLVALSQWIALVPGIHMDLARTLLLTTRTGGAGTTRSQRALPTMVMDVPTRTTTSLALPLAALSQWTALVPGMLMGLANMMPLTTRTGGAGCTRSPRAPLTTDTDAHSPTTTSLVQLLAVPSLLTVLEDGTRGWLCLLDRSVDTTPMATRTKSADCTRSLLRLRTMVSSVQRRTTSSSARPLLALSQLTAWAPGSSTEPAIMWQMATRMRDAGSTRSVPLPSTTERGAHTPTTKSLAPSPVVLSPSTVLEHGLRTAHVSTTTATTRTGGAGPTVLPPMLLTTVSDAHTPTASSSAPLRAAPSQWIAWELGVRTLSVRGTRSPTATRSAALTMLRGPLPTTGTLAHLLTRMFSAP